MSRDTCCTLSDRKSGETVVCATLISKEPPTIQDDTGSLTLMCALPTNNSNLDTGDLCLFRFKFDEAGAVLCDRVTPIPHVLAPIYQHLAEKQLRSRHS